MAKSIKFKNDNYLDSTGIVHNKVLLNEILNFDNGEVVIGTRNGKPVYKNMITGTVGTIENLLNQLNIKDIILFNGRAESRYSNVWNIPNNFSSAGYNIYFFQDTSIHLDFGDYFLADNKVSVFLIYTKTTD